MRTRNQLLLFLAAYAVYDLGRWVAAGEIGPATGHARRAGTFPAPAFAHLTGAAA